jgi:putative ABC transport system substrate-binding protein
MRRRDFLGVLSGAAAALPLAVSAQQTAMRTIGWLSARSSDTEREARSLAAFREGLAQTGYVEGRNLIALWRRTI